MPYQSRGFWKCSRCERLFDEYVDASYHESIGECGPLPLHHQQQLPPHHARIHPSNIHQGHQYSSRYAMEGTGLAAPAYHPIAAAPAAAKAPQHTHKPPGSLGGQQIQQQAPRFLFGDSDTTQLTKHDSVAVRNMEIFAVDHRGAVDSYGNPLGIGLVGIRCIHCMGSDPQAVVFPLSLVGIGDNIREVAEWHLGGCRRAPQSVCRVLQDALDRRHKAKNEGGNSWLKEEEDRRKLIDFCGIRCRELQLVERYPLGTGIMFSYFGPRSSYPSESVPLEEAKQPARPASSLDEPYDPVGIAFDELNSDPIMLPDQSLESGYEMPSNFPFFREPSGDWICKFCQHLHPQYRDAQFCWPAMHRSPPPAHFIDFHLSHCRSYQQSLLQDYRGPANPVPPGSRAQSTDITAGFAPRDLQYELSVPGEVSRGVSETRTTKGGPSTGTNAPYDEAIAFLESHDLSVVDVEGRPLPPESQLAEDEDRLLLTDFFFYLFKQLRPCRFKEADRKTRGGKRQTIKIGYGGLQCVHCAAKSNPRKFFWATVDRLANSFWEIPNHILKCQHCPEKTRNSLLILKGSHSEQMTRLPRGSQKIFLRKMWRKLHENDPTDDVAGTAVAASGFSKRRPKQPPPPIETSMPDTTPPRPSKIARKKETTEESPGTSASDGTVVVVERSSEEAAKALAYAAMQSGPPSPSSRVLLSTPDDRQWLSDHDCFIRKQVEVFCATREDIEQAAAENKGNIREGQVGLRCIHCALSKQRSLNGDSVSYPPSIGAIYDTVREFVRLHLESCRNLHRDARNHLAESKGASSLSSVLRKYYQMSAKSIGLVDAGDMIRATGQYVPLQSQDFTFGDRKLPPREGVVEEPEKPGTEK